MGQQHPPPSVQANMPLTHPVAGTPPILKAKQRRCSSRQAWALNTGRVSGCKGTEIAHFAESHIRNGFYRIRKLRPEGI